MRAVTEVRTADLSPLELRELRQLLDEAFDGRFDDVDWDHALGGVHVLVREDGELVGHAAVVPRRLVHRGVGIRTGYLEGLAVRADRRRRGHGGAAMAAAERIVRSTYDLGALSDGTRIDGFYERRGWLRWSGPTWVLASRGPERTAGDDDTLRVLPTPTSPELDTTGTIACDWRPGDVW